MNHRGRQLDDAHFSASNAGMGYLDATNFTNQSLSTHILVPPTITLKVLRGTKDLLAEQPIRFWQSCPVVDRLWASDFLPPRRHFLGIGYADSYRIDSPITHRYSPFFLLSSSPCLGVLS